MVIKKVVILSFVALNMIGAEHVQTKQVVAVKVQYCDANNVPVQTRFVTFFIDDKDTIIDANLQIVRHPGNAILIPIAQNKIPKIRRLTYKFNSGVLSLQQYFDQIKTYNLVPAQVEAQVKGCRLVAG